jgi:hypothetical protein
MMDKTVVVINRILENRTLVLLILLLGFAPYFYLSFFSHPISDDFSYAYKSTLSPLFTQLKAEYLNWSGRYTSNLLVLNNPIAYGSFLGYRLVPIFLMLSTVFALYLLLREVSDRLLKKMENLIIAVLLTLTYLHKMPLISEGIYWYTGAVTYQLGMVFFIFYATALSRLIKEKRSSKKTLLFFSTLLLAGITIGFNEIVMIYTLLLSVLVVWFKKSKWSIEFVVVVASCCAVVYFAPGNQVRLAHFENNHQLLHSLGMSFFQSLRFISDWVSQAPLLLLSLLYLPIHRKLQSSVALFKNSFYLSLPWSLLLLFGVVFISIFPAYWSTGIIGQHRTVNIAYLLFILLWFVNLSVLYNRYLANFKMGNLTVTRISAVVLFFTLIFGYNGYHALEDITKGTASNFDQEMTERLNLMRTVQVDSVYFSPILSKPRTLFVLEITENPNDWRNQGYALYFKKQETKVFLGE